jgi:hypothetical protein
MYKVFTASWQIQARREERMKKMEQIYLSRFGQADHSKVKRVREWIYLHPRREELLAFLNDADSCGI